MEEEVAGVTALDAGSRLVHIGPHKTGTTAIQGALDLARERLAERGIVYTEDRHPARAALVVTGRPPLFGGSPLDGKDWDGLVAELNAAGDRLAVVSSEFFAEADDAAARRIVQDLSPPGGSRVHVVVTLRPLARILPSQWQQYVQNGTRMAYGQWLDSMFNKPPYDRPNPTFWKRHRHDQLIARWAAAVGPENLTVLVLDESDRGALLRNFESLLGLPANFLPMDQQQENRSLTLAETEVVRQFNLEFKSSDLPVELYASYMRRGAVLRMKTGRKPAADEARITTPAWALDRAAEIGAEMAQKIPTLGVRIVGDIDSLAMRPKDEPEAPAPDATQTAITVQAVLGAIEASGDVDPQEQSVNQRRVRDVTTTELMVVVAKRIARRVASMARRDRSA